MSSDPQSEVERLSKLSDKFFARFKTNPSITNISQSIETLEIALALPCHLTFPPVNLARIKSTIANRRMIRFRLDSTQVEDINRAEILVKEALVATCAINHHLWIHFLQELGFILRIQGEDVYHGSPPLELLNRTIAVWEQIERLPGYRGRSPSLYLLEIYITHYQKTFDDEDIRKALVGHENLLQLHTGISDEERRACLSNLSDILRCRYQRTWHDADIEQSISFGRVAIAQIPPNRAIATYKCNLSRSLFRLYQSRGNISNLNEAIDLADQACNTAGVEPGLVMQFSASLCNFLRTRYEHLEELGDLDLAVTLAEKFINLAPEGVTRANGLNTLAILWGRHYQRTEQLCELEKAIGRAREAVGIICSDGDKDRHARVNTLGMLLGFLFARTKLLGDVGEAIERTEEALKLVRLVDVGITLALGKRE